MLQFYSNMVLIAFGPLTLDRLAQSNPWMLRLFNHHTDASADFLMRVLIVGVLASGIIGVASYILLHTRQKISRHSPKQDYHFSVHLYRGVLLLKFLLLLAVAALAYDIAERLSSVDSYDHDLAAIVTGNARLLMLLCLPQFTLLLIGLADCILRNKQLEQALSREQELISQRDQLQHRAKEQTETILHEQEKLREAKNVAESANSAKSDFLANMSHELRTPLNSVIGLGQIMLSTPMNEAQREMMETMQDSSTNLLEIVNDILDISKIEASKLELEHIPFSPHRCIGRVMNMLMQDASKKGLTLNLHDHDIATLVVYGDPVRFTRILTNLVGNAIKYTNQGSIDLYITCTSPGNETVLLTIEVRDTGIGIPPEKLGKIFDKFVQADTSTTRKYGGSGLGLAITKQLAEMMGGRVVVKSVLGKGSVFSFAIPFVVSAALPENHEAEVAVAQEGSIPAAQVRMLVAEDHVLNQIYIRRLLSMLGIAHVTLVEDGESAKDAALGGMYDVLLMDCHMPRLSGYDAVRVIRGAETSIRLPIVAMTANAMIGERERCIECGMDDYVSKPIDHAILKNILSRWIRFDNSHAPINIQNSMPVAQTPRLDLSTLKTFSEDDLTLERDFANAFYDQCALHLSQLHEHCIDGQCDAWKELAHSIKGGAATLGAMKLRSLALDAQEKWVATQDERLRMLQGLIQEFELVCKELRDLALLD